MGEQQCFLLLICRQGSTVGCRGRERVFVEKPNQLLVPPCQFGAAWAPHHLVEKVCTPAGPVSPFLLVCQIPFPHFYTFYNGSTVFWDFFC